MSKIKLQVENYLREQVQFIKNSNALLYYDFVYKYKNLKAIYDNFNLFGKVKSLSIFREMWKSADARVFYSIEDSIFYVVFDYNRQFEDDNSIIKMY